MNTRFGSEGFLNIHVKTSTIRNYDKKHCIDYVHVNPLKHGLVSRVEDWPWSSFHRYVRMGEYSNDWGSAANWYGDEYKHFE